MTSNSKSEGRFICPAGDRLAYHYTSEENGLVLRRYWNNACPCCTITHSCSKERWISFLRTTFEVCDTICQARLIPLGLVRPRGLRIEK